MKEPNDQNSIDSPTGIAVRFPDCPQCGYSWTGLGSTGVCPECGLEFDDHSTVVRGSRKSWIRIASILVLALALLAGPVGVMGDMLADLYPLAIPVFAAALIVVASLACFREYRRARRGSVCMLFRDRMILGTRLGSERQTIEWRDVQLIRNRTQGVDYCAEIVLTGGRRISIEWFESAREVQEFVGQMQSCLHRWKTTRRDGSSDAKAESIASQESCQR